MTKYVLEANSALHITSLKSEVHLSRYLEIHFMSHRRHAIRKTNRFILFIGMVIVGWHLAVYLLCLFFDLEAVRSSETSVKLYRTTRRNIPEDSNLYSYRCEDVKFRKDMGKFAHSFPILGLYRSSAFMWRSCVCCPLVLAARTRS
jgi:hypothetical protein